jgi:uncharacterized protein (TIGR00730 family)
MNKLKSIAVFCGSSDGNDPKIIEQAEELGRKMASDKVNLVYGGAKVGIMGRIAKSVLDNKGRVIGVIPEFLKLKEVVHKGLTELHTVSNMHERKLKIHELSDGFIALPGGFGTFEELFEITTWAQLGLHQKPIGLLNSNGFYDDLVNMITTMTKKGLLKPENTNLLLVDSDVNQLLEVMRSYIPRPVPKWLNSERT